ncbi:MAG: hypothetical protein JW881_00800 [Spirochaetales bacterium]|nr:hypothetical protein [Spirochaetales bacterium]
MKSKYLNQIKAFLLAHQIGEDRGGYLTKLEQIYTMPLSEWNGKLPSAAKFKPNLKRCKVVEATPKKPIIPWWWYMEQHEPVPSIVENIYKNIEFDFVLLYPDKNVWIYIIVEPDKKELELLKDQRNLRAFIMISLINKNLSPKERTSQRLRLAKVMNSTDIKKIFTFVAFSQDYPYFKSLSKQIPTLSSIVGASTTNWRIYYPGEKHIFSSFRDLLDTLF